MQKCERVLSSPSDILRNPDTSISPRRRQPNQHQLGPVTAAGTQHFHAFRRKIQPHWGSDPKTGPGPVQGPRPGACQPVAPTSWEAHARSQVAAESTLEAGGPEPQGAMAGRPGWQPAPPRFQMLLSLHKEHSRSNAPAVCSALGSRQHRSLRGVSPQPGPSLGAVSTWASCPPPAVLQATAHLRRTSPGRPVGLHSAARQPFLNKARVDRVEL